MSGDVCKRLRTLLTTQFHDAFERSLEDLTKTRGSELWIVGVNMKARKLIDVCGTIGPSNMAILNSNSVTDADAGFRADAQTIFPQLGKTIDIFLLNVDHFEKSDDELVPLVVHELAHYLEHIGETAAGSAADKGNAAALFISLERKVQRIHTRKWAEWLAIGARGVIKAGKLKHKTIKSFLEEAIPEYDRNGPISVRE
jgi:hypothetical protein